MTNTSDSVSSDAPRRGSQQVFELATSLGIPSMVARRLAHLAMANNEDMKRHIVLILTKADLVNAEITSTDEERRGDQRVQVVTHECEHSTITLNIQITDELGRDRRAILFGTRRTAYNVQGVEGLTYEDYETARRASGNAPSIDIMNDVIDPLNDIYTRSEARPAANTSSNYGENLYGSAAMFSSNSMSSNLDGEDWHRRFGITSDLEDTSGEGKTTRTKPLFEPLKAQFKPLLKIGEQIDALKTYENISSVNYDRGNNYIKIKTKSIRAGRKVIGKFEIMLNLRDKSAVMRRMPHNFLKDSSTNDVSQSQISKLSRTKTWCAHPFVEAVTKKGFGKVCFGDSFSIYQDAINNGDYFSAVNLILELLVTKTGNPYTSWEDYYELVNSNAELVKKKTRRKK